jgi:hypothetical protein
MVDTGHSIDWNIDYRICTLLMITSVSSDEFQYRV